ncbi:MAG: FMN-binding protein [Clostridia bacterium]|nr:FMN-binding protein [Clostridia bacterium]
MRKITALLAAGVLVVGLLTGCSGGQYKDGTYEGKSSADDRGAIGQVKITIENGKIAKADYQGIQKDGTPKDQNYGKAAGEESYKKAQVSVEASAKYGPKLVETQDVEKVDVISGATKSNTQFKEAVKDALAKAKK